MLLLRLAIRQSQQGSCKIKVLQIYARGSRSIVHGYPQHSSAMHEMPCKNLRCELYVCQTLFSKHLTLHSLQPFVTSSHILVYQCKLVSIGCFDSNATISLLCNRVVVLFCISYCSLGVHCKTLRKKTVYEIIILLTLIIT